MGILSNFSISHISINRAIVSINEQVFYFEKRLSAVSVYDLEYIEDVIEQAKEICENYNPKHFRIRGIEYDDKRSNTRVFVDVFGAHESMPNGVFPSNWLYDFCFKKREMYLSDGFDLNAIEYYDDFRLWVNGRSSFPWG